MKKELFELEYGEFLGLSTKNWDLPKMSIVGNIGDMSNFSVQVSLKGEIDKDSLYYIVNGNIYELDIDFLRPNIMDTLNYFITGFEYIKKGKLEAIKVPFKYLTKHNIINMNFDKEEKLIKEAMNEKAMDDLLLTWKPAFLEIPSREFSVKTVVKETTSVQLNRLLTVDDFALAVREHTESIKDSLLLKRDKYSPDNWDSFFRKVAMRKQKSVLSVCDGFLDKDLENYYYLLDLLAQNDNISDEFNSNQKLQEEIEDVFDSLINWFILQKLQMLKQVRAKL